jgi:predicted ATP-dependent serine protease
MTPPFISLTEIALNTGIPRHTVRRIAQRLNLGTKAGWNIVLIPEDQTKIEEYYARPHHPQAIRSQSSLDGIAAASATATATA